MLGRRKLMAGAAVAALFAAAAGSASHAADETGDALAPHGAPIEIALAADEAAAAVESGVPQTETAATARWKAVLFAALAAAGLLAAFSKTFRRDLGRAAASLKAAPRAAWKAARSPGAALSAMGRGARRFAIRLAVIALGLLALVAGSAEALAMLMEPTSLMALGAGGFALYGGWRLYQYARRAYAAAAARIAAILEPGPAA